MLAAVAGLARVYGIDPEIRYAGGRLELRFDPGGGTPPEPAVAGEVRAIISRLQATAEGPEP